ncbi:MAG TPA: acyloxyacyl hydrolase [Devosiaceae bacterium]|jgi:hypothetical protein
MRHLLFAIMALAALVVGSVPASAQMLGGVELRGGVYARGADNHGIDVSHIEDLNAEVLFTLPTVDSFIMFGQLRPHVGATVNFNDHESLAYAGLSYTVPLGNTFFVEGAFGGAIHNGPLHGATGDDRNLGCRVLFHEELSIGANLTQNASAMLTAEHASHAGLCGDDNRGITNLGIRVGFKF